MSGPWTTTEAIWPSFSPSESRLKNTNAERRRSRSLAFWICEASEASVHKLAKARGCFEGSRQCILSREKTTPWQIPNETVWPRKLLPTNMTKYIGNFHKKISDFFGNSISKEILPQEIICICRRSQFWDLFMKTLRNRVSKTKFGDFLWKFPRFFLGMFPWNYISNWAWKSLSMYENFFQF